jgi:hypothetical protein
VRVEARDGFLPELSDTVAVLNQTRLSECRYSVVAAELQPRRTSGDSGLDATMQHPFAMCSSPRIRIDEFMTPGRHLLLTSAVLCGLSLHAGLHLCSSSSMLAVQAECAAV